MSEPHHRDSLVTAYHDLLGEGDPLAEWEQLQEGMAAHHLYFGSRPVCSVLRPFLLPTQEYARVRRAAFHFFGALTTLYHWLMADDGMRHQVGLRAVEEAALHVEPGYDSPDGIGRLDGFFTTDGGIQFVEYNADSPGGLLYGHELATLFEQLPTLRRFAADHPLRLAKVAGTVLDTLLEHYRRWGGSEATPRIAIVDWEGQSTANEFLLCQEHFGRAGIPTVITHPGALTIRGNELWDDVSGQAVQIVYKRVLVGELLNTVGLENPLTDAMRQGAACVVNSYRAQLLFQKSLFALLSEYRRSDHFTPAQQRAIRDHLPWSRLLREGRTHFHGEEIDLLPWALDAQEHLVLKPNSEYGGKGIVLGWEVSPGEWHAALQAALDSGEAHIVQERIFVRTEPFPLVRDGTLRLEERFADIDPYIFAPHRVEGAGVRLGSSGLLNVTAGGGSAVPLAVVG